MNNLKINNIYESISKAQFDSVVEIKIMFLTGDENLGFYVAEIGPHQRVGAHYHFAGTEIYQVLEGSGEIHIGKPIDEKNVEWTLSKKVKVGDCFTIKEGQVHQLINDQDEKLLILFACPKSHLSDNRVMVAGFE